ncbi:lysis protein [Hafnia alvei]|uniref:phage holin n=1 Tax=Hafnia alvei TaxID=569 RepID=UPI002DB78075|nr:phage holin [Hafnia alvei]MEB7890992.1 lysis protein [Hafnia alvei]
MHTGLADKTLLAGGVSSWLFSAINYFSPSEWMIIGIIVGIFCTIGGFVSGVYFRLRRDRLLREWIRNRQVIAVAPMDEELDVLERD